MASISFFEQLTSSVSLSMMTIISVITLAVILIATVGCRIFFSSTKKSKSSSSKQQTNKDKKSKEANTKKPSTDTTTTSSNKKKPKKNATPTAPVKAAISSTSTSSQSEESEEEKVDLVQKTKKPNKASAGKKPSPIDTNNKAANVNNDNKTPSIPAKQQQAPARNENVSGDAKKKQTKAVETPAPTKQQAPAKNTASNKVNTNVSNKKPIVAANSEPKQDSPTVDESNIEQEDEGQWVTQGGKQVTSRHKNKGKNETNTAANNNNQQSASKSSKDRKSGSEKQKATAAPSLAKADSDVETTSMPSINPTPAPARLQEPIEICQLLPTGENRYTASDDWWKQALNKQQTFAIADIGDWPERDQDEQYVVNVKRIVPVKQMNNNTKTALTEKDINVDDNDHVQNYKNAQDDQKSNFSEQTNSSSVLTDESANTTSHSKKAATNVRRIS